VKDLHIVGIESKVEITYTTEIWTCLVVPRKRVLHIVSEGVSQDVRGKGGSPRKFAYKVTFKQFDTIFTVRPGVFNNFEIICE
jgi:hypothetical protein